MIKKFILVVLFLLFTVKPVLAVDYIYKFTIKDMVNSTIKDASIPKDIKRATLALLKNEKNNARYVKASRFVVFVWDKKTTIAIQFLPARISYTTNKPVLVPVLFNLVMVDSNNIVLLWSRKNF